MKKPLKTYENSKSTLVFGTDFFENNEKIIIDIEKFIIYYVIK
jgi:hypothetical protein